MMIEIKEWLLTGGGVDWEGSKETNCSNGAVHILVMGMVA